MGSPAAGLGRAVGGENKNKRILGGEGGGSDVDREEGRGGGNGAMRLGRKRRGGSKRGEGSPVSENCVMSFFI